MLAQCSKGWHNGQNDITVWWSFFLSVLKNAYGVLAQKVEGKTSSAPKGDMVRRVINDQVGSFSLSEIATQIPGVSLSMIKKTLMTMKKEGTVKIPAEAAVRYGRLFRNHEPTAYHSAETHSHEGPYIHDFRLLREN